MNQIPNTEPTRILIASDGEPIVVPASVAEGVKWSARKFQLIKAGHLSDEAEAIVQREMQEEADAG